MKYKTILFYSLILSSNALLADPLTDYMFGLALDDKKIQNYMAKKNIIENGSLPTVSSRFKQSLGRIKGSSYTVEVIDDGVIKEILLTNAHLLQGEKKQVVFDRINDFGTKESFEFSILDSEVKICGNQDIAVVDLTRIKSLVKIPSFGTYNIQNDQITTYGQNNSPRGYYLMDDYGEAWPYPNQNMKPLFKNDQTGEMLNFIQMGNMFDFSCNYFPSSPEHYDGNAIFIPINSRVKEFTNAPAPFVQKIFNNVNSLYVHQQRVLQNTCRIEMNKKLMEGQRVKTSHFSSNLIVPAGIVPGMSGAPLIANNNLKQSEYKIIGMVSSYNRRMQQSHFISSKNIKKCIQKAIHQDEVSPSSVDFAFSPELNTLYRKSKNYVEIPLSTRSAGHFFGGDGAAGNGGDGAAGNGGLGPTGKPVSGMLFNGEHVLGFNCPVGKKNVNVFANWEYKNFQESTKIQCTPIGIKSKISLASLLRNKVGRIKIKKIKASNQVMNSLKLKAKISILKDESIKLEISGSYYLKERDKEIGFKDQVIIKQNLGKFNPYYELKITEDNITNFFNDYKGGESLVIDLKELFFINLEQIKASSKSIEQILIQNNRPKLYGSLKFKSSKKGSIPVELVW